MTRKISAFTLFLFALCLVPRASFASTVTLVLESKGITPYDFSVNGSSSYIELSCLNDQRTVYQYEKWDAVATKLDAIIAKPSLITGSGLSVPELQQDAYLDSLYYINATTSAQKTYNQEVQDAIWSVLDGTDVYSGLSGGYNGAQETEVRKLLADATSTKELSSFYSQFTFYVPVAGTFPSGDGTPQQFMGYKALTPEPSSLMLLGTGLAGLAGSLRRRYRASNKA